MVFHFNNVEIRRGERCLYIGIKKMPAISIISRSIIDISMYCCVRGVASQALEISFLHYACCYTIYPTLGCDIQGFRAMGLSVQYWPRWFPNFSGDINGCTIRSKWGPFGDLYLARTNRLCAWNMLFLVEIKYSQRRTRPVKSLWWPYVPMQESTNEWKNPTFFK